MHHITWESHKTIAMIKRKATKAGIMKVKALVVLWGKGTINILQAVRDHNFMGTIEINMVLN